MTPEREAELAKAKAIAATIEAQFKIKDHEESVRNARMVLLIVAIGEIVLGLWQAFGPLNSMIGLYVEAVLGAIFFMLYFISKSYPLPALIAGLIVYILPQLLILMISFSAFFSGSIWKIIIIILLTIGIVAAAKIPKKVESNDELLDEIESPLEDL